MPITILEHELQENELPLVETKVKTTITISEHELIENELPLVETEVKTTITISEYELPLAKCKESNYNLRI